LRHLGNFKAAEDPDKPLKSTGLYKKYILYLGISSLSQSSLTHFPGSCNMTVNDKPPIFCEKYCIVCKGARAGNSICKAIQDLELKICGKNGCIWGKARTKFYGVTPDQKIPEKYGKQ